MGQRANLVIAKQDGYDLYYNHWCANTLPRDLFWGPQHAISFIEAQSKVDKTEWLDDVWAEGAAVVDPENKLLLFFGGEEELWNIHYRRLFLKLMQKVWGEWELRWADEGIVDIAEYVGVPRETVLSRKHDDLADASLAPPENKEWVDTMVSIAFDDGETLIFPHYGGIEGVLLHGPELLRSCNRAFGHKQFRIRDWTEEFPASGVHIDANSKQIDLWHADTMSNLVQLLNTLWPDWEVRDHSDRYEVQSERTAGRLHFPEVDRNELLSDITSSLLSAPSNPLDSLASMVETLKKEGKEVSVSEYAYMHENVDVPENSRERIVQYAVSALEKEGE